MKKTIQKISLYLILAMLINIILITKTSISPIAVKGLNIFMLAIFLWATELIHPTLTGMLIFCLIPALAIMSPAETFQVMGELIIWRLLGIFIITKGMEKTGLARRIALKILSLARGNLYFLLFLMEFITFAFVFLVPAVAARTAILASICMGLVTKLEDGSNTNFAKAASITIPVTSLITSNTIIVGASATIYAVGFFEKNLHYQITYISWLGTMLPGSIMAMVAIFFIVTRLYPFPRRLTGEISYLKDDINKLGKITAQELKMIIILVILLFAWFFNLDDKYPVEFIAGTILFLPGIKILERKETFRLLDWETIMLFGSGLAMVESLNKSAAIDFLVSNLSHQVGDLNEFAAVFAIVIITVVVRLGMANMTGVVATLLPVFTSLSLVMGINPIWADSICIMASGLGILMPSQSSSNLTTYCYGYYSPRDFFRTGILVVISYAVIIALIATFYWPLLGINFRR